MRKMARSKLISLFLVVSFMVFSAPHLWCRGDGEREITGTTGNLLGFVYGSDRTTPLEGAVLVLRNVSTGDVYESGASDSVGVVRVEGLERGLYIVGIRAGEGDYNVESLIGIREDATAKVSVALDTGAEAPSVQEGGEKSEECPRGEWYVPETEGVCDEGYEWNAEKSRCECKKKSFFAFFATPAGIAVISAFAVGATIGAITLSGDSDDVSPFR